MLGRVFWRVTDQSRAQQGKGRAEADQSGVTLSFMLVSFQAKLHIVVKIHLPAQLKLNN